MSSDRQNCLFLVRHGQSCTNSGKEATNETNILTRKGLKQAFRAGENMEKYKFAAAFSSPLARALQTATTLLSAADHDPIEVQRVPDFVERKYGFDRFLKWEELEALLGTENLKRSDMDIDYQAESIEKQRSIFERILHPFLSMVVPALDHGNVLVVSHFYVQRAFQSFIEGSGPELMPDFYPDNATPAKYPRSRVLRAVTAWSDRVSQSNVTMNEPAYCGHDMMDDDGGSHRA